MDSLEYIDSYRRGALSAEQARQMEERIEHDTVFVQEVTFYLTAMQALKEQLAAQKKERFKKLYRQSRA